MKLQILIIITFIFISHIYTHNDPVLSDVIFEYTVKYPGTDLTTWFELINCSFPDIYDLGDALVPKTLFIPSDKAFAEWPWTDNATFMNQVMRYHFVHGIVDFPQGTKPVMLNSYLGIQNIHNNTISQAISMHRQENDYFVHHFKGDAKIVCGPIDAGQFSRLYIIDQVLFPPLYFQSAIQYFPLEQTNALVNAVNYSHFVNDRPVTIFAVVDSDAGGQYLLDSNTDLEALIEYHMCDEVVYAVDAMNAAFTLPTVSGSSLMFYQYRNTLYVNNVKVLKTDIYLASGGVMHILDKWLDVSVRLPIPDIQAIKDAANSNNIPNSASPYQQMFQESDSPFGGFQEYVLEEGTDYIIIPVFDASSNGISLDSCILSKDSNEMDCQDGSCIVYGNCLNGYCDGLTQCTGVANCQIIGDCDMGSCTVIGGCIKTTVDQIAAQASISESLTSSGISERSQLSAKISPLLLAIVVIAAILF